MKIYFKNIIKVLNTIDNPLKLKENLKRKDELEREFYDEEAKYYLNNFDEDLFRYDENEYFPPRHKHFYSLLGDIEGKKILDCCCGYGFTSVKCAKMGARVTGIDISPKMIELAKKNAKFNNVFDFVDLQIMSVQDMDFDSEIFDYATGIGALHHLNLELAGKEISRVLKPGGKAIFLEPRIPFKWIMLVRSFIPIACDESPGGGSISERELSDFTKYFSNYKLHYFLLLRKFFRIPILNKYASIFDRIDRRLIKEFPILKNLCWAFVLEFIK